MLLLGAGAKAGSNATAGAQRARRHRRETSSSLTNSGGCCCFGFRVLLVFFFFYGFLPQLPTESCSKIEERLESEN